MDEETVAVEARTVVNAADRGDHVRRLEDPHSGTSVRLSKGAHVTPERSGTPRCRAQDDVRVTCRSWYDLLVLGTTDTEYTGDRDP